MLPGSRCGGMGLGLCWQQQPGACWSCPALPSVAAWPFAAAPGKKKKKKTKNEIKTYIWRNTRSHAAGSDRLERRVPPRCVCWKPSPRVAIFNSSDRAIVGAPLLSRLPVKGALGTQSLLLHGGSWCVCHLQLASCSHQRHKYNLLFFFFYSFFLFWRALRLIYL